MRHNVIIDWVRGLSVLVVVCLHSSAFVPKLITTLGGAAANGYYGVTAFFCTSGFLITSNLVRRYGEVARVDLRSFYVMRFGRIAPPLTLLCVVLLGLSLMHLPAFVFTPSMSLKGVLLSILTFRYNIYYQRGGQLSSWAILWSLSVEEMFYLGYPLVAKLTRHTQCLVAVLLGIIVCALVHRLGGLLTVYDYFGCFDAIAIGALAALGVRHGGATMTKPAAWAFLGVGAATAVYTYLRVDMHTVYVVGLLLIALGVGLVLFASQCAPFVGLRMWRYDPLAYCGRLSYEIYLFHMTIFFLLTPLFTFSSTEPSVLLYALELLCIIAVSHTVHSFYSEPINRWLRAKLLLRAS